MGKPPGGRLTNPETWRGALPEAVFAGLCDWSAAQPFTVTHVRRLLAGRSGSYVAVVRIQPDHGRLHEAVLKLLPPQIGIDESRGVGLAEQWTPPKFWADHMVATTARTAVPMTDWWLHIQRVAHADLAQLRPMAELVDDPRFAEFCGTVIDAISRDWHRDADPSPHPHTPQSFLSGFLAGHREGLEVFAKAAGLSLDTPPHSAVVPGRGGPLPNPFALLSGVLTDPESGALVKGPVDIHVSNGHGDLQLYNVLVPTPGPITAQDFRLIDYGRFSQETPVSRDPVKLLLSAAGIWLLALRSATALRSSLAELVVAPMRYPEAAPVTGYLAVARRIHQAASHWGMTRDMPEAWARQHLLVMIGSALRTVADRDLDLADRWWFYEVAALATRAYGEAVRHEDRIHQPTPPSLKRQPEAAAPQPYEPGRPVERPAEPLPHTTAPSFPGTTKLEFVRRLSTSWSELADLLDIPSYERATFQAGHEAREVWEWLEVRWRLAELPAALRRIGRKDLAQLLSPQ